MINLFPIPNFKKIKERLIFGPNWAKMLADDLPIFLRAPPGLVLLKNKSFRMVSLK